MSIHVFKIYFHLEKQAWEWFHTVECVIVLVLSSNRWPEVNRTWKPVSIQSLDGAYKNSNIQLLNKG